MSLLSVIQDVCRATSQSVPAQVVASTDVTVQQMYQLANEEGIFLAKSFEWQRIRRQWTLSAAGTELQPDWLPDDIDRFVFGTQFDRTMMRRVIGPLTPQMWQAIKAMPQLNPVFLGWIEREDEVLVTPSPTAGDEIAYEYISKNWVQSETGTKQDKFLADTDQSLLGDWLIYLGVRWRWLSAKGLDYSEQFRTYELAKQIQQAKDGGNDVLNAAGLTQFIWPNNVPLGSFPGTTP